MTPELYDRIGRTYTSTRATDPRIAAAVWEAIGDARTVLNVGAGTGHYEPTDRDVVALEPSSVMIAQRPAGAAPVVQGRAEALPFEDDSFDTVVSTLVLCGVDDQPRALREARRVLRPGGQLLFLEHVRSDDPGLARFQDRMNWLNNLLVGCDCNRPTLATIEAEKFEVSRIERTTMPKAPKFVRPLIVGTATSPL